MIYTHEIKSFFDKCTIAGGGEFKRQLASFLEELGERFLDIICDEIVRRGAVDTGRLLGSFQKDSSVWVLSQGALTLEIGTDVEYAQFVNDGHWTCPSGEKMRFIHGYWSGGRFIYDANSDTGMMLKQKWVQGVHFWESGLKIVDEMIPHLVDRKIQEWIDGYFGVR